MPLNHINILYIDDDADDIFLVKSLIQKLSSSKYTLTGALSYTDAEIQMRQQNFDLFLVDYKLNELNGIEVLEKLKAINKHTPVILLTGMESPELDTQALAVGAADYLVKGSFYAKDLERSIRYAVRNAKLLQELEINSNRFKSIFEHSADAIILINKSTEIVNANASFCKIFGDTAVTNKIDFSSFITIATDINFFLEALINDEQLIDFETVLLDVNNHKINALINLVVHSVEAGLYQVMIKNVTVLKEKELEQHTQKQFNATARMSRMLAHEIKNPLTNISLSVDQLNYELPQNIKDDCGDLIKIIDRNAKRINELISQLLNATRLAEINLSNYSINNLINEVVKQASDSAKLKQIILTTDLKDDACIDIDVEKIKIALFNLIINAIEVVDEITGVITVKSFKEKNKHYIQVADNGTGLSKEQMEKIFEPFFTSKKTGTGLGLTNAQNIMLNHQGTLKVESEPNKGCIFCMIFPEKNE